MTRWRTKKTTRTLPSGTKVQRNELVEAPELEWRLQASAVRRLRARPEYGVLFTLAADFNAGRRSPQEAVKAKATGLTAGEPDLRCYIAGGRLLLIEMKAKNGHLSQVQKDRHAELRALGFEIEVVKASTEEMAADLVELVVLQRLPANDNWRTAA